MNILNNKNIEIRFVLKMSPSCISNFDLQYSIFLVILWKMETHPVRVKTVKDPGSDKSNVQHQCVLVAQPQSTAQRPPTCDLRMDNFDCSVIPTVTTSGRQSSGKLRYPHPLFGAFSTVEGGRQDEEETDKQVV